MIYNPDKYNNMDYFRNDPVEIVHRCKSNLDIETMGIVLSLIHI